MEYYLALNGIVSLVILLLVRFFPASVKYRFRIVSFALFLWLVPWHQVGSLIPVSYESNINWIIPSITISSEGSERVQSSNWYILRNWQYALYALFGFGGLILLRKLFAHYRWQRSLVIDNNLRNSLTNENLPDVFFSQSISTAVIVGIVSPKILISSKLANSPHLETIIAHEKQHIATKDNLKLFILMTIESLFWWNPLVRELTSELRFLIEAGCDEALCNEMGEAQYLDVISSLMLKQQSFPSSSMASAALSTRKNNLKRVKQIKDKPTMNLSKKLGYIFTLLLSVSTISVFALGDHPKSVEIEADKKTMDYLESSISLNFQNIPLEALMKVVYEYAELDGFVLADVLKNEKININAQKIPLTQFFDMMSANYNLKILIEDKMLVVKENTGGFRKGATLKYVGNENELGALIDFDVEITKPVGKEGINTRKADFSIWTEFNKQSFIKIDDTLQMAIKVFDREDIASVEMKFIELKDSPTLEVIAEPAIATKYNKPATIEIGNDATGERLYVKIKPVKTQKPT